MADDGETYVVKLRGSAQGVQQLVAEVVVGEIGRVLGLVVPEIVLVDIIPDFPEGEQDPHIRRSLQASIGLNVGLKFVPGATMFDAAARDVVDPLLASKILWLDYFSLNIDRTVKNPNLLQDLHKLYLIDHGAALYFHFDPMWGTLNQKLTAPLPGLKNHVLWPWATRFLEATVFALATLRREHFESIINLIPDELLITRDDMPLPEAQRDLYLQFLVARLELSVHFDQVVQDARNDIL